MLWPHCFYHSIFLEIQLLWTIFNRRGFFLLLTLHSATQASLCYSGFILLLCASFCYYSFILLLKLCSTTIGLILLLRLHSATQVWSCYSGLILLLRLCSPTMASFCYDWLCSATINLYLLLHYAILNTDGLVLLLLTSICKSTVLFSIFETPFYYYMLCSAALGYFLYVAPFSNYQLQFATLGYIQSMHHHFYQ
jgi:hypothetical protein